MLSSGAAEPFVLTLYQKVSMKGEEIFSNVGEDFILKDAACELNIF